LVNNEDWAYFDINMKFIASGNGIEALKPHLQENQCGFAFWRIFRDNVGNTGQGQFSESNIVLQWKGPKTNAIAKVKSNTGLDAAQKQWKGPKTNAIAKVKSNTGLYAAQKQCPPPSKGFIEVLTKGPILSSETIYNRFKPGSGSKTIQD